MLRAVLELRKWFIGMSRATQMPGPLWRPEALPLLMTRTASYIDTNPSIQVLQLLFWVRLTTAQTELGGMWPFLCGLPSELTVQPPFPTPPASTEARQPAVSPLHTLHLGVARRWEGEFCGGWGGVFLERLFSLPSLETMPEWGSSWIATPSCKPEDRPYRLGMAAP